MNSYNKFMCNPKPPCNCYSYKPCCKPCCNKCCRPQSNILNSLFCVENFLCCTQKACTICKFINFFK